tara:strand:- start:846 stop:1472 length:627 start_codon:yes stop_codon:yes gene_type:complete
MASTSGTLQNIFKSRKVLLDLLSEQGYNTDDYSDFTINELNILFQNKQLDMLLENSDNKKLYIKYHLGKSVRPANINEYIEDLYDLENILSKDDGLLIIVKDEPNDTLTALVKQIWNTTKRYVSLIYIARLQFNILEHELVPKHERMTQEEKESIYKLYNINSDEQVPEISRFDPVALAICLRPGELCKITRQSKTAILSNFYRLCIN